MKESLLRRPRISMRICYLLLSIHLISYKHIFTANPLVEYWTVNHTPSIMQILNACDWAPAIEIESVLTPNSNSRRIFSTSMLASKYLRFFSMQRLQKINLTDTESNICKVLLEVANEINVNKPSHERITLRIAGGWVRDKNVQT
ncbi:hypothetical protein BC829DRAFT_44369 [Chytridium lagenaria]|nr:hypothetical protein BC829DRAFT_44369 [Chytridium lagenaria]